MLFQIKLWMNQLSRSLKKAPPGRILFCVVVLIVLAVISLASIIRPKPNPLDSHEVFLIRDKGVLRVGVRNDLLGFGYYDQDTEAWSGLEIEIAREICAKVFDDPDQIEFVSVNSRTATQKLASGDVDIVLALKTPRESRYLATVPYYIDAFATMVRESTYATYEDLNGRTLGVLQELGAAAPEQPPSMLAMEELAKKRRLTFEYRVYASFPELKEALEMNLVDAIVFPTAYLPKYYDTSKVMISEAISQEPYCALVKKTDKNMLEIANAVIRNMASSGALQALYAKYSLPVFGQPG